MRNASSRIWNWVNKKTDATSNRGIRPKAREAIYGLLNCVEINLKNCDNSGKLRVEAAPTWPFRRSNPKSSGRIWNWVNKKKLTRLAIGEFAPWARGAIYALLNCVEISFKKSRQLGEITCRIGADVTFSASQCEMRQVEYETELIKNWHEY